MTRHVQKIIRATIAVQVAALEWENSDIDDDTSFEVVEQCMKELQRAFKVWKKDCE